MSGLVEGKVALITGGAGGIGRAACELFAREGASVAVVDIAADGAEETAEKLSGGGYAAIAITADLTQEGDVVAAVARTVERFGRLDCAFNNAVITDAARPLVELDLETWNRMLAVNLTAVFLCMKHEARQMLQQEPIDGRRGAIVNTSSGAGVIAAPGLPHYTAAKHGVLGVSKNAAQELYADGIRVNSVCPGATDTAMTRSFLEASPEMEEMLRNTMPGGEIGRPEDVAAAAVWLCSERARWVNGEAMLVDGGSVCR